MPIDVSDIINDPDFVGDFSLIRTAGAFQDDGTWASSELVQQRRGIVLPAKNDYLDFLPEGERHKETIAVYCVLDILLGDPTANQADIIYYDGGFYKVAFTKHYKQVNCFFGLATRFYRDGNASTVAAGSWAPIAPYPPRAYDLSAQIDGLKTIFALTVAPILPSSMLLFFNGQLMSQQDYRLAGLQLDVTPGINGVDTGFAPKVGDFLTAVM